MTREEAIKVIWKMLAYTDLNVRANLNADMIDACHMAIKVLKQEPVLDKIRTEIEQLPTTKCTETCAIYIDADDFKENVFEIIDKYKAESEK